MMNNGKDSFTRVARDRYSIAEAGLEIVREMFILLQKEDKPIPSQCTNVKTPIIGDRASGNLLLFILRGFHQVCHGGPDDIQS